MTKQEKYSMNIKDITKSIKQQLKKEFPRCKFSVSIERYSMGQSMTVSLMEAPFEAIVNIGSIISGKFVSTEEQGYEFKKSAQLNQYTFKNGYNNNETVPGWNNGAILTQQAWKVMKRAVEITQHFNYDDSDSMVDHFDVNFYLHLNIGKWDKPFVKISNNTKVTTHYKDNGDKALAKMGLI